MNAKTVSLAGEMFMSSSDKPDYKNVSAAVVRRQLASRDLLGGGNELRIEHNGEIYVLRRTRQGKLILTK
jgi:hemin uptake protein HemP